MKKLHLMVLLAGTVGIVNGQKPALSHSDSLLGAGMHYLKGPSALTGKLKAKACFLAAAKEGNAQAMAMLGAFYYAGGKTKSSGDSAVFWLTSAATAGNAGSWQRLGRLYQQGSRGISQDFVKSGESFYRGMLAGDKNSKYMLAYYYFKGLGRQQDYAAAFRLFSQLAKSDHYLKAMYFLGLSYRNGYGTDRNADSANYWLKQAAKINYYQAIDELAVATPENPLKPVAAPVKPDAPGLEAVYRQAADGNLSQWVKGEYRGYAIRYDWSGNHIISISPLQTSFNAGSNEVSGTWVEGNDTAVIHATIEGNTLQFKNTQYLKADHYTPHGPELWQFKTAMLGLQQTADSIYLKGNVNLYSTHRKEPGNPLYIYLAKAISPADKSLPGNITVSASPNPFHDRLQVQFALSNSQPVTITLLDMQGRVLSSEKKGMLPAGTYIQAINIPSSLSAGACIVSVNAGNSAKQAILVKQ